MAEAELGLCTQLLWLQSLTHFHMGGFLFTVEQILCNKKCEEASGLVYFCLLTMMQMSLSM